MIVFWALSPDGYNFLTSCHLGTSFLSFICSVPGTGGRWSNSSPKGPAQVLYTWRVWGGGMLCDGWTSPCPTRVLADQSSHRGTSAQACEEKARGTWGDAAKGDLRKKVKGLVWRSEREEAMWKWPCWGHILGGRCSALSLGGLG